MSGLREDLIAAKALIGTPERWCRHSGHEVKRKWHGLGVTHSYCIIGAIVTAIADENDSFRAENALRAAAPTPWLVSFNGNPATTHADIMALFDRAIAKAEGGAS